MSTIRIGRRGQITIPKSVREILGVDEGDRIAFVAKHGAVTLQPMRTTLRDHRGTVEVEGPQDFEAVRDSVRRARSRTGDPPDRSS